jgi:hypothetical protein
MLPFLTGFFSGTVTLVSTVAKSVAVVSFDISIPS